MIYLRKYGWCLKDKNFRSSYKLIEIKKLVLKSLLSSSFYSIVNKLYFSSLFLLFNKNSSLSRYRNSCSFSNSSRVVFRKFKLSRHFCKKFASNGYLIGLRKASF